MRSLLEQVRAGLKVEPDFEARLLIALGSFGGRSGDETRALGYLEEASALVGALDDRRRGAYLSALAISYRERGDLEAAIRTANQALARYRESMLDREAAAMENELALTYMGLGSLDRARTHIATSEALLRALGDERNLAHSVETRAQIELAGGDLAAAERVAQEALELANDHDNHKAAISASLTLARISRRAGDLAKAAERMEAAAELARAHARPQQLRDVLTEWSDVMAELGDDRAAFRISREALEQARR
jgi:tetratricopeptide (TPR) repeat protein